MDALLKLSSQIEGCEKCPRLRKHCTEIAKIKKREFRDWDYWGKPVPGFGTSNAKLWIVGLAPGAHGANRTGRMFTGDMSGHWLYQALYEAGFASQKESSHRKDGLKLIRTYISAAGRCAPPDNKPTPQELANCRPYLQEELQLLEKVEAILCLGKIATDAVAKLLGTRIEFKHGKVTHVGKFRVYTSYHPSRQNTQTGRLTREMWNKVFLGIKKSFLA